MANKTPSSGDGPFLGGGPKFNQAGNNKPMPGEKVADGAPPQFFGGPRVWTGIAVVLILVAVLWFTLGDQLYGVHQTGGHGGIDMNSRPNPDSIDQPSK